MNTSPPFKFTGKGKFDKDNKNWNLLERRPLDPFDDPESYFVTDAGLIDAVNTALLLDMPLLLTGEPGVGKTQLAYRLALELGCGEPLFFSVKSTSAASDLFYNIDYLRRLHAAQTAKEQNAADIDIRQFIQFQGLGKAILRAMPEEQLRKLDLVKHAWPDNPQPQPPRQPSVVLIDEIDKAPPDFCNDMLEEIRRKQFLVPEISRDPISIAAWKKPDANNNDHDNDRYRPFIVITSNSERTLPEPFLRRCIFHHIQPPETEQLVKIVEQRLGKDGSLPVVLDESLRDDCINFFEFLRAELGEQAKKPSTAELLNWLLTVAKRKFSFQDKRQYNADWQRCAQACLLKSKEQAADMEGYFKTWRDRAKSKSKSG
ncbi:MAG: MoxR family ATPase [Methylomonas sp.]|jgi:MoxR-like ATPase